MRRGNRKGKNYKKERKWKKKRMDEKEGYGNDRGWEGNRKEGKNNNIRNRLDKGDEDLRRNERERSGSGIWWYWKSEKNWGMVGNDRKKEEGRRMMVEEK